MKRNYLVIGLILILAAMMLAACQTPAATAPEAPKAEAGSSGPAKEAAAPTTAPAAPAAPSAPAAPAAEPAVAVAPANMETLPLEQCTTCHKRMGGEHQAFYNTLYQDGKITVTDVRYSFTAPSTHTVNFTLTKNGTPAAAKDMDSIGIYYTRTLTVNSNSNPNSNALISKARSPAMLPENASALRKAPTRSTRRTSAPATVSL